MAFLSGHKSHTMDSERASKLASSSQAFSPLFSLLAAKTPSAHAKISHSAWVRIPVPWHSRVICWHSLTGLSAPLPPWKLLTQQHATDHTVAWTHESMRKLILSKLISNSSTSRKPSLQPSHIHTAWGPGTRRPLIHTLEYSAAYPVLSLLTWHIHLYNNLGGLLWI